MVLLPSVFKALCQGGTDTASKELTTRQEFGKQSRRKRPSETEEMARKYKEVWNSMAFSGNNRWFGMTRK